MNNKTICRTIFLVCALAAIFLFHTATAAQATATEDDGYYTYQGKRIALKFDASQVAIHAPSTTESWTDADKAESAAYVVAQLSSFGFSAADATAHPIKGWVTLNVKTALERAGGDARGTEAIRALIKSIARNPTIEFVSPVAKDSSGNPIIITPSILMEFKSGTTADVAEKILAETGTLRTRPQVSDVGPVTVQFDLRDGFGVLAAANRLSAKPEVLYAEPDFIMTSRADLIPNDPWFAQSWHLNNTGQSGGLAGFDMDADAAWDVTTGSPSVIVVILDQGIQQNHPDINQIPGRDFTSDAPLNPNGGPFGTYDNHGTPVAGCVSGIIDNAVGSVGVAPGVKVASARFGTGSDASGNYSFQVSWFTNALSWAQTIGARVTNNSNSFGGTSSAIDSSYANTRNAGLVHFASAGNSGTSTIAYPASSAAVNSVAAANRFGSRSYFSQHGTGLDFIAPGEEIVTADRTGSAGYGSGDVVTVSGTSFASPNTAAVAALVISQNPGFTAAQVEARLQSTAVDLGPAGYDTGYGWGLVNARRVLNPSGIPSAPTATAATNVTSSGFIANWDSSTGATGYRLDVSTSSTFGTYVSGYQNLDVGNVASQAVTGLDANTTYHYRVRAYNSAGTSSNSNVISLVTTGPPPLNDQCSGAVALSAGVTRTDSTVNATSTGDPVPTCQDNSVKGVWYTFTPASSGTVTVGTCGSDFDTVLQVYTGSCGGLTAVAGGCNDDNGPECTGTSASVSFSATAGTTYRILAGGYNAANGNLQIVARVTPTATRIIGLSGSLAFGNVSVGSSAQRTLTITNSGNSPMTVSSISYPAGFSGSFSGAIAAGSSQDVTVTFAPTAAAIYGGTVTVNSDATSGTNTTSCSGTGVLSSTRIIGLSGSLAFGNVPVGTSSQRTLTISNSGNSALSVSSITYPAGFSGSYSGTIAASSSQDVLVTFAPTAAITYGGTVTVNSDATSGAGSATASGSGTTPTQTATFRAVSPARLWDSRSGPGPVGRLGPGQVRNVTVTGVGGVPATGVTAVVLNVTAVSPTAGTHVTVWPAGEAKPLASNLNVPARDVRPNLVIVNVGADGAVSFFNHDGDVDLIADVAGWFGPGAGEKYTGLSPARVWDSRSGPGPAGQVGPGEARNVTITGMGGVPTTGVSAVVLNVTAVNPSAATHVTVWPTGESQPLASNLNVPAGDVRPNLVIVKVGAGGGVSFFNYDGNLDIVADVAGWFGPSGEHQFTGVSPARVWDSRSGPGPTGPSAPGQSRDVAVTGMAGVPTTGVSAVVLNVTAVNPSAPTHLTVWPTGEPMPVASNLNVPPGDVRPNLVIAKVGAGGRVSFFNYDGNVDVVADIAGWFGTSGASGDGGVVTYHERESSSAAAMVTRDPQR